MQTCHSRAQQLATSAWLHACAKPLNSVSGVQLQMGSATPPLVCLAQVGSPLLCKGGWARCDQCCIAAHAVCRLNLERIDAEGVTGQDAVEALTFLADFHKASTPGGVQCSWDGSQSVIETASTT